MNDDDYTPTPGFLILIGYNADWTEAAPVSKKRLIAPPPPESGPRMCVSAAKRRPGRWQKESRSCEVCGRQYSAPNKAQLTCSRQCGYRKRVRSKIRLFNDYYEENT